VGEGRRERRALQSLRGLAEEEDGRGTRGRTALAARGDPGRVVAGGRVRRDATRRRRMTPPVAFASALETEAPRAVAVVEAEGMDSLAQIRMDWSDMFEIEVFPVVTAEQGLEMARQAMSSGQG
jgi:hypothetical protein